jgi:acetyltransferase-like isoleucine patch superfamily enzyme
VWINTLQLNDPYLVSIGDGTVIGGDAVISPHVFEYGCLILEPVRIGAGCLIGAEAYISPGVTIGDGSVIGLRSHVRRGTNVPPGSRLISPAGLSPERVYEIERGHRGGRRREGGQGPQ